MKKIMVLALILAGLSYPMGWALTIPSDEGNGKFLKEIFEILVLINKKIDIYIMNQNSTVYTLHNNNSHHEPEITHQNNSETEDDHRLTLRIPKYLMEKVDKKRKQRVGKISRNLWILEAIESACDA